MEIPKNGMGDRPLTLRLWDCRESLAAPLPLLTSIVLHTNIYSQKLEAPSSFKFLHLGMICEIPRKSLPAIAKAVDLNNEQPLLHFLTESPWEVTALRNQRLEVIIAYG